TRLRNRAELNERISVALASLTRESVCDELMRQGIPIGPVNTVPEAFGQPHTAHRRMQVNTDGYRGVGIPTRLARTPGRITNGPPAYGQNTEEVLRESGIDDDRIASLREQGVLP